MKHRISDFIYKKIMIPGLARLINENRMPPHNTEEPMTADEKAKLTFLVWGDPQISFLSPLRSGRVYTAVRDLKHMIGKADALVLAGDLTEYGAWAEFRMLHRLLESAQDKFGSLFAVSGNHDIRLRRYKKQLRRFNDFLELFPNGVHGGGEHYYFSHTVNGYPFLMMGADRTCFEASYISDAQLAWLDSELKKADGKPVFIFNHQPLYRTNGLPLTWQGFGDWRGDIGRQSDKVRTVFEKYHNIIYITGHLHYGTCQYNYEDLGSIKVVSVPTVGVLNHGDNSVTAQGFFFSVYEDKILVRARSHGEGKFFPKDIANHAFEIVLN